MDPILVQLRAEFDQRKAAYDTINAKGAAVTPEELASAEALVGQLEETQAKISARHDLLKRTEALQEWAGSGTAMVPFPTGQQQAAAGALVPAELAPGREAAPQKITVPAQSIRLRVTAFKSDEFGTAHEKAFGFGQWLAATCGRNLKARKWCAEHGVPLAVLQGNDDQVINLAHAEEINSAGGWA
jgi:hypothetical protein